MTLATFILILIGVMLNAGAQLLLKAGVQPLGALSVGWDTLWPTALKVLAQWPIIAGLACYVVSVGVWIVGLSRVEVSLAYPMLSMGYVVNALAAWWLFGESLGPMRWAGMMLILAGVLVMSRSQ
jgi:multidrug transporter EmrE-like cation transporter